MKSRKKQSMLAMLFFTLIASLCAHADVLRPLKIELSVFPQGVYKMDIHASLEALMSGATRASALRNPDIKAEFERLAGLSPDALRTEFGDRQGNLVDKIAIMLNGKQVRPEIGIVEIPAAKENGERTSVVRMSGQLPEDIEYIDFGYSHSLGQVVFRYRHLDEGSQTWGDWVWLSRVKSGQQDAGGADDTAQSLQKTVTDYVQLGFTHILPKGLDHILFIIGLFLLSTRFRPLLMQVTAFTLAHTLTLGLTMQGWISLSPAIVEPLIAFSIAWVGIENILHKDLHRFRIVLVFLFGLLHGMGFAGVLTGLGLPQGQLLTSLLSFNAGVELGQLAILLLCFTFISIPMRNQGWYRRGIVIPASLLIAVVGGYWGIERSLGIV